MSRAQVLIVDDDPALLEALPEALRLRIDDLDVDTSDSGQEALKRITETDYDALVVDIKMPGMDGLELLTEIKRISPETPTILITGHGDHDLAVEALRIGAQDYVTKPIDREYFVSSLNRAIECHRLSREVSTKRLEELLHQTEELEACVQERTVELREALHREQVARRELDEANRRLEERGQERDLFVTMVAHDLATPLTTIRGWVELLGRPNADPERQARARSLIVSETERVARLAELTDAAQVAPGQFRIKTAPCDLVEIAREQIEMIRDQTTHHVIQLDAPASLPLPCDRDRLAQVLLNLLTNAIKYAADGEIRVRLQRDGEQVLLSVTDQGPGIPPERAEAVFEPGRSLARDSADEPTPGHGFGLYIVKGIVEAHGGRIWVEPTSDDRAGATLCISLPLTLPAAIEPPDVTAMDRHQSSVCGTA